MSGVHLMLAITERGKAEKFIRLFTEHNVYVVDCLLAEGTAASEVLDYLSLEASEKALMLAIVTDDTLMPLNRDFVEKLFIDIPGNGIVATIPVNSIGGMRSLKYLTEGQKLVLKGDTNMSWNTDYELILVIANEGYTDLVMEAARSAKATGGTVVKAKGTGAEHANKFLGFTIAAEKEMILIVSPTGNRNSIMKAVMAQAGLESKAQSIVFSLPISSVAGLRKLEENGGSVDFDVTERHAVHCKSAAAREKRGCPVEYDDREDPVSREQTTQCNNGIYRHKQK